jgi:Na+/proline symporter
MSSDQLLMGFPRLPAFLLMAGESAPLVSLHQLDWVMVGIYGCFIFAVAIRYAGKIRDCGGFFVGSRKMGKWSMMAASFAGGTNASHPMAVAAATFQQGLSGAWLSLTWILITPFLWMYPPVVRRLRIVTTVDIVRMRYGPTMAGFFKIVSLLVVPVGMGLGIKSGAIVLEVMSGGAITGFWAIAIICVPTMIYTVLGGVIAAYVTDIYQGLLIVVLSFLLIPFAIVEAGGFDALNQNIDSNMMSLFSGNTGDFGFWWIFWFAIGIIFAATISSAGGAAAAKDESTARQKVWGYIIKRFCTLGWAWAGILAIALYASHPMLNEASGLAGASSNNVFPLLSGELLPIGLRGIMVASIIAAVMSSLDASSIYFSSLGVSNIYQEHFVRNASPTHYLMVARLLCIVGMALGWWVATGIEDLVHFATISEPINGVVGMSIFVALVWRRVTAKGAVASVLVSVPLYIAVSQPTWGPGFSLFQLMHLQPVAEMLAGWYGIDLLGPHSSYLTPEGLVKMLPVQVRYPMYLVPSLLTIVGVSLVTRQHDVRAVGEFYCRLDTPIGEEHKIREAGYTEDHLKRLDQKNPEVALRTEGARTERLLLADLFYLPEKLRRGEVRWGDYRPDLVGIIGFSVFVVAFILGVEAIGKLF